MMGQSKPGGVAFWAKGTAYANVLWQVGVWNARGAARRSAWLEQYVQGVV